MTDINHEALHKYQQSRKPDGELPAIDKSQTSQTAIDALWDRVREQTQTETNILIRDCHG